MPTPSPSPDRDIGGASPAQTPGGPMATPTGARKCGRPDDLGPYKAGLMYHYLSVYKSLSDAPKKDVSNFITAVARAWYKQFGMLPWKTEPPVDPGPPPSLDISLAALHADAKNQVEIDEINDFLRKIRKKILSWFQNHNKHRDMNHSTDIRVVAEILNNIFFTRPQARSVRDVYISTKWGNGLQEAVQKKIDEVAADGNKLSRMTIQNNMITECWEKETAQYKALLEAQTKADNDRAMEEYRLRAFKVAESIIEFAKAWDEAEDFLFPLLECISVYLGVPVSIFFFGPDPHNGGVIRMKCMHSEVQRGQAGMSWSDMPSFAAVRASGEEFALRYWGASRIPERALSPGSSGGPSVEPAIIGSSQPLTHLNTGSSPSSPDDGTIDPLLRGGNDTDIARQAPTIVTSPSPSARSTTINDDDDLESNHSLPFSSLASTDMDFYVPQDADGFDLINEYEVIDALIPARMEHSHSRLMIGRELPSMFKPKFAKLLRALVAFEDASGHVTGKYSTSPTRPTEIGYWHKSRRPKTGPKLLPDFGTRLQDWWKEMQPPLRLVNNVLVQSGKYDWVDYDVFRCGQYGNTLVVLAIAWWGLGINTSVTGAATEETKQWFDLVDDVTWVLGEMLPMAPLLSIEVESDEEEDQPVQKRTRSGSIASKPLSRVSARLADKNPVPTKPISKRKRN